jgi:Protein of unknown function (DUF2934)
VPRKNQTNQTEKSPEGANSISSLNGEKKKRRATSKKPVGKKSRTSTRKARMSPKSAPPSAAAEPSDEMIRTRAYFIAERRHRLGLPGDASSDWLEAKRQLLSELGPR